MHLSLFKTTWGHEGSLTQAMELATSAGFSGLEAPAPLAPQERADFFCQMDRHRLQWIAEVCTCTPEGSYLPTPGLSAADHLKSLEEGVVRSLEGSPQFINTMAGHDAWDHAEAMKFHKGVLQLEQRHGMAISVETHRGRSSYNPWRMRDILIELPELKITCDFSHWCVVAERLVLDEEPEILALAAAHAHHIQPRVGYAQGPQVPDPRAPEYAVELAAHERWWDAVWESMAARGVTNFTMTPEFGPDGYLQCAPFTRQPVADLWELNRWIGLRQKERFSRRFNLYP